VSLCILSLLQYCEYCVHTLMHAANVFIIFYPPEFGYSVWPKPTGAWKLSFVRWLEISQFLFINYSCSFLPYKRDIVCYTAHCVPVCPSVTSSRSKHAIRFTLHGRALLQIFRARTRRSESRPEQCVLSGAVNDLLCDGFLKSEIGAAIFGMRCAPAVIDTADGSRPSPACQADLHCD
jgi:hypothetical protein